VSSLERLILVGGMCSGKSTVGRLTAQHLGWAFIDFDQTIERYQGRTVADIFRDRGEPYFRTLEAELTAEVEQERQVVLAPGGGWITQPELVRRLRPGSLVVWLKVSPESAWERHRQQSTVERPLLAVEDPLEGMRAILLQREGLYAQSDAVIDTDERDPGTVAEEVVALLNLQREAGRSDRAPLTSG
jgi:shikimate kinase